MDSEARSTYNDVFSRTISDSERDALLNSPTPILVEAIGETLLDTKDEGIQKLVPQKAIPKVFRGSVIPKVVQEFNTYMTTGEKRSLAPFVNGRDSEYLAIFCGFIEAMQKLNQEQPELARGIIDNFKEKSEVALKQNPSYSEGQKAVETIVGKINTN